MWCELVVTDQVLDFFDSKFLIPCVTSCLTLNITTFTHEVANFQLDENLTKPQISN